MPGKKKEAVSDAIAALRADPKLTRYAAAKQFGIWPGALYNSKACQQLFAERKKMQNIK